jgi:phosphonate transport system substrate-binding protein
MKAIYFALFLAVLSGCTHKASDLGTAENPVKFFFVPSVDVKLLEDTSKIMKTYLEAHTPYKYKIAIPNSYIAVVEAFGTKRADIAALNTYGYVLAHEKYGAEARLITVRYGETTYQAQYLAKAGGKITKLEDLNGKKVAFVDPSSISGYLLPMKYLKDKHIKPKETVFAMRHDNVISMIYQGQVDAGVTFYSPPAEGEIQDARRLVRAQYPDVEKKIKIIELSAPIPNDPIVFRKDIPEDMKKKIIDELIKFARTPEGLIALKKLSSITGLAPCSDHDFDSTREAVKELGEAGANH